MEKRISYENLLEIISWGVFNRGIKGVQPQGVRELKSKRIDGAEYGGIYTGSPGRDIFFMLPYFTDIQMKEVAFKLAEKYPYVPPANHVQHAMCIRFIYGQFAKQGILRSEKDFNRMKEEKIDWSLSRKFLKLLHEEFDNMKKYYGLSILYEMEGHRLGDEALINKDISKLDEMEKTYNKSVEYASKCKSYKQLFTPYFWASKYFMKFKDKKRAIKYSKLTIINANKYCPDSRKSYVEKLATCLQYLKDKDENWNKFYKKYKKNIKNKCVKRAFKEIKK